MSAFLKIPKLGMQSFFLGFVSGFLAASISPKFGRAYYAFCLGQANQLNAAPGVAASDVWLTLTIYLRNLSIALLITIFPLLLVYQTLAYRKKYPFKSGDFVQRVKSELHVVLTMYSISVLFAYGFAVFGLFLASVFVENSFQGLMQWSLYLVPHGILETLGMISAASTGLVVRDSWLRDFNPEFQNSWRQVPKRIYEDQLLFLLIILLISAFLEVYVSRGFVKFVYEVAKL